MFYHYWLWLTFCLTSLRLLLSMRPQIGENATLKLRHAWVWGSVATLLLLLSGVAFAQQSPGNQEGGLWLPFAASDYSPKIDGLYVFIFWITTAMFVLTEGLLIGFCIVYRRRPGHKPHYTHGNNKAELIWTIVPALMLLGIAVVQIGTWNEIKKPDWTEMAKAPDVTVVDTIGEQFKWNFRYPGTKEWFNKTKESDMDPIETDFSTVGSLHMPFGNRVLLNLRAADVIHSLFIPHMRVKQDTVPGLRQRIWFKPNRIQVIKTREPADRQSYKTLKPYKIHPLKDETSSDYFLPKFDWAGDPKAFESGGTFFDRKIAVHGYVQLESGLYGPVNPESKKIRILHKGEIKEGQAWADADGAIGIFEIACAELCGLGHYKMRGQLVVEPRIAFEAWLKDTAEDELGEIWKKKLWRD